MRFWLIGYGSLLNEKSFAKTLKLRPFRPVTVKGFKRVFNLAIRPGAGANVLNVLPKKNAHFNGVLFSVTEKELFVLKRREFDYNIVPCTAHDFKTGKRIRNCWVMSNELIMLDKKNRLPNKPYFIVCREGAYSISEAFGKEWDATTFTSSGTRISNWIKKRPGYDAISV
jgi:hypothetical protein